MTGVALLAAVILLAVLVGWLLLGALGAFMEGEREWVDLNAHPPLEGRFCPQPGCGGLLAYRRAKMGEGFGTWLHCWRCGARWLIHDEPDYEGNGRREKQAKQDERRAG
jgi:hypothetical protein